MGGFVRVCDLFHYVQQRVVGQRPVFRAELEENYPIARCAAELHVPPPPDPLDVLPQRPAELDRLEREVYLSLGSSFYLHHRLRPLLREIASSRLLLRHGLDLDHRTEKAARLVGPQAWEWLRPDRTEPRDRWAPGPPLAELTSIIDALERI